MVSRYIKLPNTDVIILSLDDILHDVPVLVRDEPAAPDIEDLKVHEIK